MQNLSYRFWKFARQARYWLEARVAFALLALAKLLPPGAAIRTADWLGRTAGPRTSRHQLALDNLRHAFPEKTRRNARKSRSACGGTCSGSAPNTSTSNA
jgi:KDO2-lipid IV(A) lauroyltransferase